MAAREQATVLEAFERALSREAHVLARRPGLTWQQLHSRLQWEDEPGLIELLVSARESRKGAQPWLWTRTPPRESTLLIRVLEDPEQQLLTCAFSTDGSLVAAAGLGGVVRVWDPSTGAELRAFGHSDAEVACCAFSPDGGLLATGDWAGRVRLWHPRDGTEQEGWPISGFGNARVEACAFSPDGSVLAVGDWAGSVRLWDWHTRDEVLELDTGSRVEDCTFSPDGRAVATLNEDDTVRLWDREQARRRWRRPKPRLVLPATGRVSALAFRPDGQLLAAAESERGAVTLWDPRTGVSIAALTDDGFPSTTGTSGWVRSCRFSPDGTLLATAERIGEIRLWDVEAGTCVTLLTGHAGGASSCVFSPDGQLLATAGGRTVEVWDTSTSGVTPPSERSRRHVQALVLDAQRLAPPRWSPRAAAEPESHTHSPDGQLVASRTARGIAVRDVRTGEERYTAEHPALIRDTAEYDPFTGRVHERREMTLAPRVRSWAFSPDARWLVTAGDDGRILVWDTKSGEERHRLTGGSFAVSPAGDVLATGNGDVDLVRLEDGTRRQLGGAGGGCAFSPDACLLASVTRNGVGLWEIASAHELARLPGAGGPLAFHPAIPVLTCGADIVELANIVYGPLLVTATDDGEGPVVTCPACGRLTAPFDGAGTRVACRVCGADLQVNPRVLWTAEW